MDTDRSASRQARPAEEWHRLQPAATAVAAIIAIALLARYFSGVPSPGPNGRPYGDLVEHRVWSVLAAVSVVSWALAAVRTVHIAALPFHDETIPARTRLVRGIGPIVLYVVFAGSLLFGMAVARLTTVKVPQGELGHRASLLVVLAVAGAGVPVIGMWQSYARLRGLATALDGRGRAWTAVEFIAELREAWGHAQRCLGVLAVLVGTGTVLTGALRNTLLAAGYRATDVPANTVLAYGASCTVLSLIVYVPLYLAWRSRASTFTDHLYPLPDDGRPSEEWADGRARLRTLLGTDTTLGKNLTAVAGILAPLATSVLTVFIPNGR